MSVRLNVSFAAVIFNKVTNASTQETRPLHLVHYPLQIFSMTSTVRFKEDEKKGQTLNRNNHGADFLYPPLYAPISKPGFARQKTV